MVTGDLGNKRPPPMSGGRLVYGAQHGIAERGSESKLDVDRDQDRGGSVVEDNPVGLPPNDQFLELALSLTLSLVSPSVVHDLGGSDRFHPDDVVPLFHQYLSSHQECTIVRDRVA